MVRLSAFSPEDAEAIYSLPYRAGLHISYAEDEGGEGDDEQEMAALEREIRQAARHYENSAFIQDIVAAALNSRDKWKKWSEGVFNIEPHCNKAAALLKGKASEQELKDYKGLVISVARAVAQAYGEFGEDVREEEGFFARALKKVGLGSGAAEADSPMNVSAAEDDAIARIKAALR